MAVPVRRPPGKLVTSPPVPEAIDPAATTGDADQDALAALARSRRDAKAHATSPPPTAPGAPAAPIAPGMEAAKLVNASRTLVARFAPASGAMSGVGGVALYKPLILEPLPATAMKLPVDADYVIATCNADESMIPPGCRTPVTRSLWHAGWRVRRDLYEAVLAEHARAARDSTTGAAQPAELPAGAGKVPTAVLIHPPADLAPPS